MSAGVFRMAGSPSRLPEKDQNQMNTQIETKKRKTLPDLLVVGPLLGDSHVASEVEVSRA